MAAFKSELGAIDNPGPAVKLGRATKTTRIPHHVCDTSDGAALDPKMEKFPVFFPVSREFSGEELARDCLLRHTSLAH